jgi:hypothetical protein
MEELKHEILDFIDTSYEPLTKEYKFLKDHDWINTELLKKREQEHGLNSMITDKAIRTASDLYKIAIADLNHKDVKKVMALCKKVFDLYEKRYHKYTSKQDWESFMEEGKDLSEVEDEMTFQNEIRGQLNTFKRTMRNINFGEDSDGIDIRTYKDTPVPFFMRELIEDRYPEVKEKMNKEKEDVTTKTKRGRGKNTKLSKKQG